MELILYWGNCLVEMKNIAEDSIDLILCDLPYGTTDRSGVDKKGNNRILGWDTVIPLDELWQQYRRVLKPTGTVVLTADQPFTSQLVISNLGWFKYEWIWKKKKTTGFLHANARPMKETEDILIFSPLGASGCSKKANKNMTYNPQGLIDKNIKKKNSVNRLGKFLHQPEHMGKNNKLLHETEYEQKYTNYPSEIIEFGLDKGSIHPTQKPVALMEYLIKTYSNEGETVLDNCMGSGTTGVACANTDRNFIGIEMDENYYKIAEDRIKNAVSLQQLEQDSSNPLTNALY
jgi:site-specific DNA-methyltransferase (adenine-specific)